MGHTPPWPVASSGTGTKSPAPLYLDDAAFSAIGRHMWNRHHIPEGVSSQAAADTDSCCLQQRVRHPVHVMTLTRITAGINKGRTSARRTGKSSPPRRCGGSSRRPWPGFLAFRGWIRQETLCDRSSVTFDLRLCTQMRELDLVQTISRNAIFAVLPSRKGYHGPA